MKNRDRRLEKARTFNIINPIRESRTTGVFEMSTTSLEKYKSNLYTLIFTGLGERVMLPEYGTRLSQMLFQNFDEVTLNDIEVEIKDAVRVWIPEIEVRKVEFEKVKENMENNRINLSIFFSLKNDAEIQDFIEIELGA
jgi:uncharacterized protein